MSSSVSHVCPPSTNEVTEDELALADAFGRQLIRFMRLVHRSKAKITKQGPDGIEQAAYGILFCLIHEGPQRTSQLSELMHSEISTVSRQTSALVQHGLVQREADPEDGRACLLAPTTEGYRVFDENRKVRTRWLAEVLHDWPEEDRATLNNLFNRLNAGIEQHDPQLADEHASAFDEGDNA